MATVHIGNVDSFIELHELCDVLAEAGTFADIRWIASHAVRCTYTTPEMAALAVATLQHRGVGSRAIWLDIARQQEAEKRPREESEKAKEEEERPAKRARKLDANVAVVRLLYVCKEATWVHTSTDKTWALQVRAKIREIDASNLNKKGGFIWHLLWLLCLGEFEEDEWADTPGMKKTLQWFESSKPTAAIDEWIEVNEYLGNADEGPFESLTAFHCAKRYDLFNGDVL